MDEKVYSYEQDNPPNIVREPVAEYSRLDLSRSYTWWDYLAWKFTDRVELIRGQVVKMSPAPNLQHQTLAGGLYGAFSKVFNHTKCRWFPAPFDVCLPVPSAVSGSTVVQPDACVICDATKFNIQGCMGAPDLVVEILSPGNSVHDLKTKYQLYEESGVKEYWVVQPETRDVLVFSLINGKYSPLPAFVLGTTVQSVLFPKLKVPVNALFYHIQ